MSNVTTPLSDLEIANKVVMQPITTIAKEAGIPEDALELYGKYKAKIDVTQLKNQTADAKVVLVTAINPTPAGEGKSTVTVGLADALHQLEQNVIVALLSSRPHAH